MIHWIAVAAIIFTLTHEKEAEAAQSSASVLYGEGYKTGEPDRSTIRFDTLAVKDWGCCMEGLIWLVSLMAIPTLLLVGLLTMEKAFIWLDKFRIKRILAKHQQGLDTQNFQKEKFGSLTHTECHQTSMEIQPIYLPTEAEHITTGQQVVSLNTRTQKKRNSNQLRSLKYRYRTKSTRFMWA